MLRTCSPALITIMKYEPTADVGRTLVELLMAEPFYQQSPDTDYELVRIVTECYDQLNDADRLILHEVYFLQNTYEDSASNVGIKAKSHAWRKTRKALDNLKEKLLDNKEFMNVYANKYVG